MDKVHKMIIGGRELKGTAREVADKMQGTEPERIDEWFTEIGGVKYPVKQVLAVYSGWPRTFTSADANRFLRRWGFDPWRTSTGKYEEHKRDAAKPHRQAISVRGRFSHRPRCSSCITPGQRVSLAGSSIRWRSCRDAPSEGVAGAQSRR